MASERIAVIGLGYVGLPLAVALARHFPVLGYDIDGARVAALRRGADRTGAVTRAALDAATGLTVGRPCRGSGRAQPVHRYGPDPGR
ncbi:MAG: hypothetical protein WDO24_17360 [Pseudomonadota bacterium]